MATYPLDTDILSLFDRHHPVVVRSVASHWADTIGISIVTVEEQIRGWQKLVGRAKSPADLSLASRLLANNVHVWAS
jgi:tRNA(fMet)-specific endonuclease VapC